MLKVTFSLGTNNVPIITFVFFKEIVILLYYLYLLLVMNWSGQQVFHM